MSGSYIEDLRRQAAEHREHRADQRREETASLEDRIRHWYEELPATERKLYYRMQDFVVLFGGSPAVIGEALWRLGWTRKRRWRAESPSRRVWEPPR